MNHGLQRLHAVPLSLRLLCEIHDVLLSKGRGSENSRAEFRKVRTGSAELGRGDASFVPPPPELVLDCMSSLETLFAEYPDLPVLIKAGLDTCRFRAIHQP